MIGIYVHVPFCRTRCRYCDFYRVGEKQERIGAFLGALEREIEGLEEHAGAPVDTIFLGGGTPSLLAPRQVVGILDALRRRFSVSSAAEVSLEANPSDLDVERLAGYRRAGIDRLSLGVQSLCDRELELLGRRHDAARAAACVGWAREAGFDNVSLDLMLAIPGQTEASFAATLERALDLAPEHLSLYLLEVHARSEMDGLRRRRPRLFPDEEAQRRRYLRAVEQLTAAGYEHYEISNFAFPGRRSRHNLRYWLGRPFLGLGPSAHSAVGGRRWRHPPDLAAYLEDPHAIEELPSEPREERVFLGLRLLDGVDRDELAAACGLSSAELERRLRELGDYVVVEAGRVRLTLDGILVSNAVFTELLTERREPAPRWPPPAASASRGAVGRG